MTSGILFISPPHLHLNFISSIPGLCKSKSFEIFFIEFLSSSSILPITLSSPHSEHLHIGRGVPQNLNRDNAQSFAPSSQFPNLPSFMCSGSQFIESFNFSNSFLIFDTEINQEVIA